MKAKIVITLLTALLLGLAATAQASDRHRSHRDGHYRGYATPNHYRYAGHYQPRHYGYRYDRHYRPYYYHGHRSHHDAFKVAAGAIILGSIIHSVNRDRSERVVYRTRSYPERSYPASGSSYQGETWYRTDSSGDCFEVHFNSEGDEVWTLSDPSNCN